MNLFECREDLEQWLNCLDYEAFWAGIAPFDLKQPLSRACSDRQIASGAVDEATVLCVLKAMARLELIERYHLRPRDPIPTWARH